MIPIFFLMVVQQTHDYLFPTDIYSTCPFLIAKLYRHGNKHTFLFQKMKKQEQQGVDKNGTRRWKVMYRRLPYSHG
jgi:hypothetical protein